MEIRVRVNVSPQKDFLCHDDDCHPHPSPSLNSLLVQDRQSSQIMHLRRFITCLILPLFLCSHRSLVQCEGEDKKQEKLINILENLQHSISEILGTLGPGNSGNPSSRPSSSSSFSKTTSPGSGYVQKPDGGDIPSGRHAPKDETTTDHSPPTDTSMNPIHGDSNGKQFAPGPSFRVSDYIINQALDL